MTEVQDPQTGRRLPRALRPFGHAAYRRLAVVLVLARLAGGGGTVGLVWEVNRTGGGPGRLSVVATASAVGVSLPALLGRVASLGLFVSISLMPVSMAIAGPVSPSSPVSPLVAARLPQEEIAHPLDQRRPPAGQAGSRVPASALREPMPSLR